MVFIKRNSSQTYFLIPNLFHVFQDSCISGYKFYRVQGPRFSGFRFFKVYVFRVQVFQGLGPGSGSMFQKQPFFVPEMKFMILETFCLRNLRLGKFFIREMSFGELSDEEMSVSGNSPFQELSFRELFVGEIFSGNWPPGKCPQEKILSVKCPLGNYPDTRVTGFIYLCSFCYLAMIDCRQIFRTLPQIYDGTLLRNWLKAKSCLNLSQMFE